ncbi:hypothetical protein AVEN_231986-1 [Araneus ventricosus]|uniref:Uncharacterized protein n=1 Tax=Araneus ventricosus TaxID=182803 RepID=A0A4Y2C246_ARAVE|nr:hypothetical protein AVEN_231986-1 [Araneus ventricosus]
MNLATPELVHPFPSFRITPTRGRLATAYDLGCNGPIYGGSPVQSGFEHGTFWSQSRDLSTGPLRVPCSLAIRSRRQQRG